MTSLLDDMAISFGIPRKRLFNIIKTAPLRYKVFFIQKKSGGLREVAQPAKEVKAIQRWLIANLGERLPLHPAATAYAPGSSIKKNARAHIESRFILKMDFANFFPSISETDIKIHLNKFCGDHYTEQDIAIVARACTWARKRSPPLRLCIGAPSSPLLSNSIMFDFDDILHQQAKQEDVTYTRYADDLTLSCSQPDVLKKYPKLITELLDKISYPSLEINKLKTIHASKSGNRTITGLILTPDDTVSIGRERKRLIRSMFHNYKTGTLNPELVSKLFGLLNFAEDIEPGFRSKLESRYDFDL